MVPAWRLGGWRARLEVGNQGVNNAGKRWS